MERWCGYVTQSDDMAVAKAIIRAAVNPGESEIKRFGRSRRRHRGSDRRGEIAMKFFEAIANVFQLAMRRDPEVKGFNPLALWNTHYLRELDDSGYIDKLYQ